ncbi:MAG TPA: selenocysteine-specific translation elongation factor [Actinomycetota bacterium]|nr:selenocysteine-specific translation elongation factor [Actinomycetota bacterium]
MPDRSPGGEPPQHVVATAGHVDHGKSSLIVRLTGIDPDRLAEEKRRGLTIDLGFAWCTLPSGIEIGFVDVPGHERFVRNMLAGVGPVRLVLFVVAADEGWEPQSEEHLAIVDVLGVDGAVIALTKVDLVDAETLEAGVSEVRERLRGTALEGSPVVPCSALTGRGLDELATALDAMVRGAPAPDDGGRPRQSIDRVFTIAGAGTVVTGTLVGGRLSIGDEVEVYPSGARARVRALQMHGRPIEAARPVSRIAANLAGLERPSLERGDLLGTPGRWRPTTALEARISPVRGLPRPLTERGAFKLYARAAERDARIWLYDVGVLPDDGAFARIRLSEPLVLDVHERFVLRESGRRETVAGGVVLDPHPPRRPGPDAGTRLAARADAGRAELPALVIRERGAVRDAELEVLTGVSASSVPGARRAGPWWIANGLLETVAAAVQEQLRAFHQAHPLAAGVDIGEVRTRIVRTVRQVGGPGDPALAGALVDELLLDGVAEREGSAIRLAAHRVALPTAEIERLVAAVAGGEPTPPTVTELRSAGFTAELVDAASTSGALVRIAPDLVLTPAFVDRAVALVRETGREGISVSTVRQALGTSRRYAVPLMEHLDRAGLTRRVGDLRYPRAT